ncbi:DUF2971 domain-containing protein [Acinetobacter venetianus]|uniref:DUF2971 domain-containing protein n=1 Tax=Acinetobacter venetianus TaxID=52133 RepID=UPI00241CE4A7|nr:DUF2971 domain-containing protein [Acinetobacter venetianus]
MSDDLKLWRYMDLTKFLELIIHQRLYFNRSDNFEDKHEGELDYQAREWLKKNPFNQAMERPINSNPEKFKYFINCWHQNDYESAAMWKLYGVIPDAVAITTNLRSLAKSLPESISIKKVTYYNDRYSSDINNLHLTQENLFSRKREAFIHEKEYRAIYHCENIEDSNIPSEATWVEKDKKPIGINFKIDIYQLIETVYISPYASPLLNSIIENILKKYQLNDIQVIKSDLYNFHK